MAAAGHPARHSSLALLRSISTPVTTPAPGRVTRTRVRTGCIVCKIRHVKCDETKPACNRCISTGRKCEGYASQANKFEISNSGESKSSSADIVITVNPFFEISGSLAERRSFHYLRVRAAHDILGYFEHGFWDRFVLQISHCEPTVRHALLALSSLCETNDSQSADEQDLSGHNPQQLSRFAMQQYTTSIRLLTDYLAAPQPRLDVALSCCLVFTWLEFFRNDFDAGLNHLESGWKILREFNGSSHLLKHLNSSTQPIDSSLTGLFNRLYIQAVIHGSPTSTFIARIPDGRTEMADAMPHAFSSIEEARKYLDEILSSIMLLVRQLCHPNTVQSPDPTFSHCSSEVKRSLYMHHLHLWHAAFFRTPHHAKYDPTIALLSLYHILSTIILDTLSPHTEMAFDLHNPSFAVLLSHATTIIASFASYPPFFLSTGVIPALFFTALKCRDLPLRRRAVALLRRAPPREGMWDRDRTALFAEAKIEIEERRRGGLAETAVLPEEARIFDEELVGVLVGGRRVVLLRYRRRKGGLVECKEELTGLGMAMGGLV